MPQSKKNNKKESSQSKIIKKPAICLKDSQGRGRG